MRQLALVNGGKTARMSTFVYIFDDSIGDISKGSKGMKFQRLTYKKEKS